jgi:hypothetical protein
MTALQPPDCLRGDYERAAWAVGYAAAALHGGWHPLFVSMLEVLATSAGRYCRLTLAQRAAANADDVAELARLRLLVREMMTDWYLLSVTRAPLGEIRPDGLDADIAKLCGIAAGPRRYSA